MGYYGQLWLRVGCLLNRRLLVQSITLWKMPNPELPLRNPSAHECVDFGLRLVTCSGCTLPLTGWSTGIDSSLSEDNECLEQCLRHGKWIQHSPSDLCSKVEYLLSIKSLT